jgi:hypothetical protein
MDMVSSIQNSLNLAATGLAKKHEKIKQTGDGDGQMRLGYIQPEEIEEEKSQPTRYDPLPSEGYTIKFSTNPQTRQYSGNVQKLNNRVGALNSLKDQLDGVREASEKLEGHLALSAQDPSSFFEDPAELMTLATEIDTFHRGAAAEVRTLRDEGVAVQYPSASLQIDLGDPSTAASSMRELRATTLSAGEFVREEIANANEHLNDLVIEKTPAPEIPQENPGDPLLAFTREVHSEMLEAGKQMLSAQANLDPVKVYELLRE